MSSITIRELAPGPALDSRAMASIRGGTGSLFGGGLGSPDVNVNVGVSQNINQVQNVEVNALNNIGILGAGFGPLKLNVSPTQSANAVIPF